MRRYIMSSKRERRRQLPVSHSLAIVGATVAPGLIFPPFIRNTKSNTQAVESVPLEHARHAAWVKSKKRGAQATKFSFLEQGRHTASTTWKRGTQASETALLEPPRHKAGTKLLRGLQLFLPDTLLGLSDKVVRGRWQELIEILASNDIHKLDLFFRRYPSMLNTPSPLLVLKPCGLVLTPFQWALATKRLQAAYVMLLRGASATQKTVTGGYTPLHLLVLPYGQSSTKLNSSQLQQLIQKMIAKGAKCNERDYDGNTPLHILAKCENRNAPELFDAFLANKAAASLQSAGYKLENLFVPSTLSLKVRRVLSQYDIYPPRQLSPAIPIPTNHKHNDNEMPWYLSDWVSFT